MEEIKEKFLPIGTVVMLKGGSKRCMITGYCAMEGEHEGKLWDYSGCLYPEGFLSSNQTCVFDHEQINKVYYMGLEDDDEERDFMKKLKELLKAREENMKNK